MKKVLLAIAAVATITSCSQNEEFENPAQSNEINFSTIVNKSTRAIITENSSFKSFIAYGYAHSEESFTGAISSTVMDAAEYGKNESNIWSTTSGHYYWPTSGKVTFFGYGGVKSAVYAKLDATFPTLTYAVLDDITKQEDLVVAQLANKTKEANNPSVNLDFKHALAQVYFKLKGSDEALTYAVSNIELLDVKTKGTFTYGTNPATSIGEWAAEAPTATYALSSLNQNITGGAAEVALNAPSQIMILMPQDASAIKVKVTYTAKKGEVEVHSADDPVTVSLTGSWKAGSKIAYVLSLNGDAINLTGSSDDTWTEKQPDDVNTDINK